MVLSIYYRYSQELLRVPKEEKVVKVEKEENLDLEKIRKPLSLGH